MSVSMQCSPHCTTFQLLKRTLDAWESLRSPSEEPNQQRKSKRAANGPVPGTPPSKRLNSLSLTGNLNLENTQSTSRDNSQQRSHLCIDESSSTTSPSITKSAEDRTHSSQSFTVSPDFIPQSSYPTESNLSTQSSKTSTLPVRNQVQRLNSVTASTPLTVARTQLTTIVSDMPARNASDWVMGKNHAMSKAMLAHELRLKYLRYNIWDSSEHFSCSSADWTETALPLTSFPDSELANPIVTKTINNNPHLFDIVTPVYVDCFEDLLKSHPNQPFVKSVCCSL